MANVTKDLFVRGMAEAEGISIKQAKEEVNRVLGHIQTVVSNLGDGEKLQLTGTVEFEVSDVPARKGRNPQTGEEIEIAASKVPAFKPGKALKDAVK